MKKAILYLSFKCSEQAKEQAQTQYDCAEKFCSENGIEMIRVFDEISVNPPLERYYFDKAYNFAKHVNAELTYFLVWDYSQITENFEEFELISGELSSFGIHIIPIAPIGAISTKEWFNNLNKEK